MSVCHPANAAVSTASRLAGELGILDVRCNGSAVRSLLPASALAAAAVAPAWDGSPSLAFCPVTWQSFAFHYAIALTRAGWLQWRRQRLWPREGTRVLPTLAPLWDADSPSAARDALRAVLNQALEMLCGAMLQRLNHKRCVVQDFVGRHSVIDKGHGATHESRTVREVCTGDGKEHSWPFVNSLSGLPSSPSRPRESFLLRAAPSA